MGGRALQRVMVQSPKLMFFEGVIFNSSQGVTFKSRKGATLKNQEGSVSQAQEGVSFERKFHSGT